MKSKSKRKKNLQDSANITSSSNNKRNGNPHLLMWKFGLLIAVLVENHKIGEFFFMFPYFYQMLPFRFTQYKPSSYLFAMEGILKQILLLNTYGIQLHVHTVIHSLWFIQYTSIFCSIKLLCLSYWKKLPKLRSKIAIKLLLSIPNDFITLEDGHRELFVFYFQHCRFLLKNCIYLNR